MGVLLDAGFTGISGGSLDRKGRVCIPASYRHVLAAQRPNIVYIRNALLMPSLEGFGAQVVQNFLAAQSESDPFFTAAHDTDAFALLSLSQELTIDDTGRVRLPDEFIAYAGLKEAITFAGLGRNFEIWDGAEFARVREERTAAARERQKARQQARNS